MGLSLQKLPPRILTGGADDQSWQPEGSSYRIEFTGTILEQIRFEASRAMNGYACIGIGGVLLGRRGPEGDVVEDWRPIACDHSRGPAFLLSARDEAALSAFLEGVTLTGAVDEDDAQVQVLGWFISHPRGDLKATEVERALHRRHLPGDSFLMIIRPDRLGDAEMQFHLPVRGSLGVVRSAEPVLLVEPLPIAKREPGQRRRKRRPAPPGAGLTVVPAKQAARGPVAAPAVAAAKKKDPKASWRLILFSGLLIGLGVAGTVMLAKPGRPEAPRVVLPADPPLEILSLHAANEGHESAITWNGRSAAVLYAIKGALEIESRGRTKQVELTPKEVQAGRFAFRHAHPTERVRMILYGEGGGSYEETTQIASVHPEEPPAVPLPADMKLPAKAGQ